MVINDKLKGEFYRTPLTKLASRNNVLTTLNELIDYFNKLSQLIDDNFEKITNTRNAMKVNLLTIYERTKHFKYVLDHFKIDVDSHITERLNDAIDNFQNKITTFVTPYEANLFNHSCVTDDVISNSVDTNSVEDWDRSINMLASELGIRWFGGKISDKSLITELDNILHITKINTYEGCTNEDYINSNLILDIFLYTPKGITWLSLGKNGDFGYNIIVKYQSKESIFNLKLLSETYNNRKEFDINTYDFDMILNTLLSRADIKNGNIYIKVKTNIPSNTESGREGYFLTSSKKFNDYEVKKGISDYSRGLMYHDNKDVAYFEHEDDNIYDIKQKTQGKIETNSILNARSDEVKDFETDSKEKNFYSEISNIGEEKYVQSIYNPDEIKMNELMDIVSGYIISNTDAEVKKNYLEGVKLNKKYDNGDSVNYTKGETVVDISDPSFVGDLSLIAKNENMFSVDNSFSKSKVVPSQFKYGTELSNETVENTFTNDESFTDINDNSYSQDADILLTPIVEQNSIIYKVVKVTDYDILILKSDGIYRFNSRDKLSNDSFTVKINHNNLFNVCYDAIVSGKIVYLATDVGVCKMNTTSFVVERTGVVGGSWCKLFETFDKTNVIAIRKDFSTNLDNGKISYGESIAMTNGGNFNTLKVIFQDNKYFTYDNPALDNELTNNEKSLDYTNKRNFQEEFKVLHNPIENKYYFFRYGHKMLVTDNANDSVMKFANFKIVNAMKDYDISDALIFENKIYFTVYEGGNYYYDLNTNVVHPVEYTTTKIINNRNTTYKSYYMSKLSNLVNDNSDSTGIVDKYQLLTPEELAAGYVEGTKYFYPSIKTLHLCTVEEKMNGPDPNIDYYGCIGTTFGVIGSWFIGKVTSFNNIDKHGVYNPDMNYGYVEFANDGKYLDYTLAVATEGFMMDPSKIHKLVHVEEELPKINCFLKVANGKLFFIPNNPDNEIRNLVYVNGYYYFATNQDYIFKLDEHFNIINQIRSEDCNEIFGAGNLLVIQNNSVTAEEITKSEAYYDRVDGSEMIEGYNPDVEYYLEKDVEEIAYSYRQITDEEYEAGPKTQSDNPNFSVLDYYKKISDDEYELYTRDLGIRRSVIEDIKTYPITAEIIQNYGNDASYYSGGGDTSYPYTEYTSEELLADSDLLASFTSEHPLNVTYYINSFIPAKEDIFIQVQTPVIEKQMTRASVDNPNDFVLTPKYNVIDSETRAQGIQDNVDYFVSRELPDKEYYDHIEPEAKTLGYDSVSFNPSEYYIGTLVEFSSIPEEEREGKPLYASNSEGTNYVLVDIYRKDVTVIDDINNFYTISDNYRQCTDDDFNFGFEFMKIDKEETPNPVDGVGYYIKLDQPDPNTGIPYADAGIGGETLYAFDITKDYYVPYRLLYHFKNDNTFGYQKTYFHKRIEDSGVEYIKAEKEHGDFKVTDTYTPLTTEEKEEGPQKGVDYYIHPTVMKDVFTKLLDKSSGIQPGVEYYKMNGTPTEVYTPLTTEEINNGPQEGEVYYIFDGGIWVEKPYASLEDGTDNNKIFSEGYVYNKKSYDYSGVEYVLCTDSDFNIITSESEGPEDQYDLTFGNIGITIKTIDKTLPYPREINKKTMEELYVKPSEIQYIRIIPSEYWYIDTIDPIKIEDKYRHLIFKKVNNEYVRITSDDIENYSQDINVSKYGLKLDGIYYKKEPFEFEYYKDTETICQLSATKRSDIEQQYGQSIYIITENGFTNINESNIDIIIPMNDMVGHLPSDREYYKKEICETGEYRRTSFADYNFDSTIEDYSTNNFKNFSFRDDVNYYKFECKVKKTSGYIENAVSKYGRVVVYPLEDRIAGEVAPINIYSLGFVGIFDESDRDIYYKVNGSTWEEPIKEDQITKFHLLENSVYRRCTQEDFERTCVLKPGVQGYYLKRNNDYINTIETSTYSNLISIEDFDIAYKQEYGSDEYIKLTEDDIDHIDYYLIDSWDNYYYHEWIFDNHRWYYDIYDRELSNISSNIITTTTKLFKDDMDYYTKSQVSEINTNEYVKATFGSKLIHTIVRGDSLRSGRDIYSGKKCTYLKTKTETGMNMYKFVEGVDEPVLLFSVNVGADSRLQYTNGKLFAFDDGLIIDYLKNEQQTWAPITLLPPSDQSVNIVHMVGDNLFLSKQITEEGPNKDKYEIYYYDYSTRSLKKCTEIEPTINSPTFYNTIDTYSNVDSDTTIISINYTPSETPHQGKEVYIFNKKFNKIEGTLNQYTSTYRYSGFKGVSDADVIDCTEKDFIKINGFTSLSRIDRYIDLIETNDGVSRGCLVLHIVSSDSQQNGKSVFYTVNNSNQLIMLPKEYSSMTDSSVDSNILSFAYKDENNRCFFVYTNATRKSIDFVYYNNPDESDTIDTPKLQLFYSFDYNADNPTADDLDPLSTINLQCSAIYYIEKITKENNDYIRFFAKFIDNETNKMRYALFNLNISGSLTNDRSILKYGIDSFDEDGKLSNLYTSVRFEQNLIVLNDSGNYSYRDLNYKLNNFDKELYYVEETPTLNDNFLMLVKEDDDRIQIYKYEEGIISPTGTYVGPFDNAEYFIIARTSDNLDDFIIFVDDIYMMKLGGEFDPSKEYFLKETSYDFFPDIPYFLKSMMVNFKLELEYFTKRIRTIVQDVISHARSYTSTDKTSKLFHKSLIKIKDNSLKVLMNVLTK